MVKANVWRLLHQSSTVEYSYSYYAAHLLSKASKFFHTHASPVFSQHCHWNSVSNSVPFVKKILLAHYRMTTSSSEQFENNTTQSGNELFPFEGQPSRTKRVRDLDKALQSINWPTDYKIKKNDDVDGDRFYTIASKDGTEYTFPSVTTILGRTLSSKNYYSLKNWKKNVVNEVGEEGYKMVRLKATSSGSNLHRCVEQRLAEEAKITPISIRPLKKSHVLSTSSPTTPAHLSPVLQLEPSPSQHTAPETKQQLADDTLYLSSLEHVLKDISEVYALESVVSHMDLGYSGTVDCIGKYKGENCVIDWKTSSRPKPSLDDCYDFPLQVVAYAGAINQDLHYPFKVYNALIVVSYPNGEPAHAHFLAHKQCRQYWQQWLARVEEFHTQFAHDLSNVYL